MRLPPISWCSHHWTPSAVVATGAWDMLQHVSNSRYATAAITSTRPMSQLSPQCIETAVAAASRRGFFFLSPRPTTTNPPLLLSTTTLLLLQDKQPDHHHTAVPGWQQTGDSRCIFTSSPWVLIFYYKMTKEEQGSRCICVSSPRYVFFFCFLFFFY